MSVYTQADGILGAAAQMLAAQGDAQSASLLGDVEELEMRHGGRLWVNVPSRQVSDEEGGPGDINFEWGRAVLFVQPWMRQRFTSEVIERVRVALFDTCFGRDFWLDRVEVACAEADPDWRDKLDKALVAQASNQGKVSHVERPKVVDGLQFASDGEVKLYEAGKRAQAKLPTHENMTLVPRPGIRVGGHTREPDLLVVFRGSGRYRTRRSAPSRSGPMKLSEGPASGGRGFAYTARVVIADANDPACSTASSTGC